jgi:hypothetical protein
MQTNKKVIGGCGNGMVKDTTGNFLLLYHTPYVK